MSDLLFETPWWLPTLLAGAGIVLFWTGNRRQETRIRTSGLVLILLAIAVCITSYLVDTDRERALKDSRQLVYAVPQQDWAMMKRLLSPNCGLEIMGGIPIYGSRDQIIDGAQKGVSQYGLKNVHVLSASADQTQDQIRVTLTILSEQDFTQGRPINSTWLMDWQKTGQTWQLIRITCVKIANLQGNAAGRQFPMAR
jgi:hypothetical protein